MSVEAGTEPAGAGGGGEEVDVLRPPARALDRPGHRLGGQLDGAALEAVVELVHRLARSHARLEGFRVEVEVAALDLAIGEETRALGIVIAGHAQDGALVEAMAGGGRRDARDLGRGHGRSVRPGYCHVQEPDASVTERSPPCLSSPSRESRRRSTPPPSSSAT